MPEVKRTEHKLEGAWSEARDVDPIFVDELELQGLGDRTYITFGQLRLPTVQAGTQPGAQVEIRPVVRLVVTTATLEKMLVALKAAMDRVQPSGAER